MRRALLTLLIGLLAVSVGADAAGTVRYPITGTTGTIAVPAAWKAIDTRTAFQSSAFRTFVNQNPALQPYLDLIAKPGSPVKLVALDPNLKGGFATNVNVVANRVPPSLTIQALAAVYTAQVKTLIPTIAGSIRTAVVRLPAGRALRATYRLGFTTNGRRTVVQSLQYVVLHAGRSVVVTLTTLPDQSRARAATFTTIVRSLRFGS